MGKTTLLRRSVARARETRGIVLSAEGSARQSLSSSFRRSLERAQHELDSPPARLKAAIESAVRALPEATIELPHDLGGLTLKPKRAKPSRSMIEAIETLNEEAKKHKRYLVFAIDEIQAVPYGGSCPNSWCMKRPAS